MLEDELFLIVIFENDRIFVVRPHFAGQTSAIQQINGHVPAALPGCAEKRFLYAGNGHGSLPPTSGSVYGENVVPRAKNSPN